MIREVWAHSLENEFKLISGIVGRYNFISMDIEFFGVIYSSKVDRRYLQPSDHYKYPKANVDTLKLIQLGLTLTDSNGNLPHFETNNCYIWEVNFSDFDVEQDPNNKDSIDMLLRQGIAFKRNVFYGVHSIHFYQLMMRYGLIFNNEVTWVTFHSAYDFGYLIRIVTQSNLPNSLEEFLSVLRILFGRNVYDMKHIIKYCNALYGGLEQVARILNVSRVVGNSHQAGSDSLLICQTFQKMVHTYFINNEVQKYVGVIFGLEVTV